MEKPRFIFTLISAIFIFQFLPVEVISQDSLDNRGISVKSERIALVIGNSAYQTAPLKNPVNDAEDIGAVLSALGFNVTVKKNVDRRTFEDAIRSFGRQLINSGVGLFYFSGHGIQAEGRNYLIPVNLCDIANYDRFSAKNWVTLLRPSGS
jgi:hypothetical protein